MSESLQTDDLSRESGAHFRVMVESVGVKSFAHDMVLSTRQINRMLSGAQPNPVERLIRCLQCCSPDVGDRALAFICQEAGGHFVKDEGTVTESVINAVKECAEAIAAISDGEVNPAARREVHEAIAALKSVLLVSAEEPSPLPGEIHVRPVNRMSSVSRSA